MATFRDKDLVVFLGDSITEDNAYAGILTDWYLTRFPERDVRFVNSGVFGDQAWRAARPDEMEDRVFSLNPSAVLVMFGPSAGQGRRGRAPSRLLPCPPATPNGIASAAPSPSPCC